MRKRNNKLSIIAIVLVFTITIGYAALTTLNRINSHVSLGTTTFTVHFDNIGEIANTATVNEAANYVDSSTKKDISFDIYLDKVGDYYSFSADIVNESTVPAKISSAEVNGLTDSQKKLLDYKVYYSGSTKELTPGDFISLNESKNITFVLTYKLSSDVEESDLSGGSSIDAVLTINYENVDIDEYRNGSISTKLMKDNNILSSKFVVFSSTTSSNEYEGIYMLESTANDVFPIYFYRGGHEAINNHVLFAGYCWRIIRTTNTGGIKMIYNGEPSNGVCISHPTSSDNVQIGEYKFGGSTDFNGSDIARYMGIWYFTNLMPYQSYIEDTPFCNNASYSSGNTSLECANNYVNSVANGKITYPIGLITAQEATLTGVIPTESSYPWLYSGNRFWTMTTSSSYQKSKYCIYNNGRLYDFEGTVTMSYGVRPVIALNSSVELNVGTGKYNDPYIVS